MSLPFPQTTLRLIVAAALAKPDGHILLQKRPQGKAMAGLWEFPGGKLEPGETPESALVRELQEELGILVRPEDMTAIAFASEAQAEAHMLLLLYLIHDWQGEPQALEAEALLWVDASNMADLPMPPADIPLVDALKKWI
ncbi:MAG: (deoxy)nucleoside triphosphate pyrophosphohydrolase [Sphingomonadaceae bacterium]|jgi:8-oxo-dGTP diphosphatase|nr:(deoxy)nucleoside triphosphate pyrophosphohydrolase [Sphingomonadaceae bacterium]NBU78967.1 (deoxy)nucleoside triphosphate pyrophosphohydrolase [Sphingomonadaceae bacterium]NCA01928.1 (deoxy)nucleoside triphosphate pyrophosphohydrolase [Sphingomonadaceae bacterium]